MSKYKVEKGYDKIAEEYSSTRDQFKNEKYLQKLNNLLKPNSTILDIGCGAGKPVDEFFVKHGHKIIGIDISRKQIELAKKNLPKANFAVKDMDTLSPNEYSVDAVISFYAIFHIPRDRHRQLVTTIYSFLPNGGYILITMGASEWEGKENFHGVEMYWSHYNEEKNKKIIQNSGFEILLNEIDTSGGEKHQVIIAKKL